MSWLWGSGAKPTEAVVNTNPDVAIEEDEVALALDDDHQERDLFILPQASMKKIRQQTHSLEKRTYYIVNNAKQEPTVYCIDAGENKWARKVELNEDFVSNLIKIDPRILAPVKDNTNIIDLLTTQEDELKDHPWPENIEFIDAPDDDEFEAEMQNKLNKEALVKLTKLNDLIDDVDAIIFKVVSQQEFNAKELQKEATRDTYFLVVDDNGLYQLYYYNVATKIEVPLLAYEKSTHTYDSLADLKNDAQDKSVFDHVNISEEGLEGFTGMLSSTLKNNDSVTPDDIKKMRDYLNYYHEPLPTPDIYQKAKKTVAEIEKHVDEFLENVLETSYYDKYFRNADKDKKGYYILPEVNNENEKAINYMQFHNMLVSMQDFLEATSNLHLKVIQPFELYNLMMKTPNVYTSFMGWMESYNNLYGYLEPLGVMTLLRNISSVSGINHELQKLIPISEGQLTKQLTTNPFYLSHLNNSENWVAILKGTDNKIIALQEILNDFSRNLPTGGEASENIQQTIIDINTLLLKFNSVEKTPQSLYETLKLLYDVYPKITALMSQLPKSGVSLHSIFEDHLLMTLEQLNLIFRDVVLNLRQFEVDYHLKSGTLLAYKFADNMSFQEMLIIFNSTVADLGYEFKQSFPFTDELLVQDKLMLSYPGTSKELLIGRIKTGEKNRAEVKYEKANDLINDRLTQLQDEKSYWAFLSNQIQHQIDKVKVGIKAVYIDGPMVRLTTYLSSWANWLLFSGIRDQKIKLLDKLKVEFSNTNSLDNAIKALYKHNPLDRSKIRLLWQGRTGEMLKEIKRQETTAQDIVDLVDLEINRLKASRDQRIIFFAGSARQRCESKIQAWQHLKKLMVKSNMSIDEALRKLNASHPEDYQILVRKDKKLIDQLQQLNAHIPKETRGKKIIDLVQDNQLVFSSREVYIKYGYVKSEIDNRIKELSYELTHAFLSAGIKKHKILLLNELKLQLNQHSISEALTNIANNKQFKDIYYLLHEGRTGKLVSNLEQTDDSNDDKINYVEQAIQRLKKIRGQEYSLFSEQEQFIEDRIYALIQLKDKLIDHPYSSFSDVLGKVFHEQQSLLSEYEQELFNKLRQWDDVNQFKRDFYIINPAPAVNEQKSVPIKANSSPEIKSAVTEAKDPLQAWDESQSEFYKSTIDNIDNLQAYTATLFKSMLNNAVYQRFFATAVKDVQGRYIIPDEHTTPKRILDYMRFYNLVINAKTLFVKLNDLHTPIVQYFAGNYLNLAAKSPALYNTMRDLLVSYHDLYFEVDQLEIVDFLEKISSPKGMSAQLQAILPPETKEHVSEFANNPFMKVVNDNRKILPEASDLNKKLDFLEKGLIVIEKSLLTDPKVQADIIKNIKDIKLLLNETRKFAESPCQLPDAIRFISHVYPALTSLSNTSSQSYMASSVVFKNYLSETLQQLNLVFQDVALGVDRFKLTNFLVDGGENDIANYRFYGTVSMNEVIATFNGFVEGLGYEFKPGERSPYQLSMLEQRKTMVLENNLPRDYLLQSIVDLNSRIILAEETTKKSRQKAGHEFVSQQKSAINAIINQRIAELTSEKTGWFNFTKTKDTKIALLNEFKQNIAQHSFDEALQIMEQNHATADKLHQLWDGRTGLMMLQIQQVSSTREDVLLLIENEINRIQSANFPSVKDVEKNIFALQLLQKLLTKNGYRVDDALATISAKHADAYAILMDTQSPLISKIREIYTYIPEHNIGKKVVNNLFTLPVNSHPEEQNYIQKEITRQIELLKNELHNRKENTKPSLFKNEEKIQKEHIQVLENLKVKLAEDPEYPIAMFIAKIPAKQRDIIKSLDKTLLADIDQWQQLKQESLPRNNPARAA